MHIPKNTRLLTCLAAGPHIAAALTALSSSWSCAADWWGRKCILHS